MGNRNFIKGLVLAAGAALVCYDRYNTSNRIKALELEVKAQGQVLAQVSSDLEVVKDDLVNSFGKLASNDKLMRDVRDTILEYKDQLDQNANQTSE